MKGSAASSTIKRILKIPSEQLNLENTLVNGQCFNWSKVTEDKFKGIYRNYIIVLQRIDDESVSLMSSPNMEEAFLNDVFLNEYLQIPRVNLTKFYKDWTARDPKYFGKVGQSLPGVRCLRQDPWDCSISFICSSNNNIKRITQLVAAMRNNYGSKISIPEEIQKEIGSSDSVTYAFPTIEQLQKATESELRGLGFGYRASYIVESVKFIKSKGGVQWLESLRKESDDDAIRKDLIQLKGVGRKVAECTMLFSMDCPGLVPVDTHVFQMAKRFGFVKAGSTTANLNDKMHQEIGDAFRNVYGDHAGWAHQILFAGDLAQFQEKINKSKGGKKRTLDDLNREENSEAETQPNSKAKPQDMMNKRQKGSK